MPSYSYSSRSRGNSRPAYGRSNYSSNRGRGKINKQFIHPSKFIQVAQTPAEVIEYVSTHKFTDFNLTQLLTNNLMAKGYETPSPIQDQAIPHVMSGKDVIGIANTGTGKTAAFALPLLDKLLREPNSRAIIIAPTRELAQQIEEECKSFAKGSGLFGAVLIGGSSMSAQLRDLRSNPQIVIGTPGRIKDHTERGTLNLSRFNIVVLDEVDRMVDMGFINDIRHLLGLVASPRQSLFFSATIDSSVTSLINTFLKDPITISVKTGDTASNINQDVIRYQRSGEKLDKLHEVLIKEATMKTLVFDETQRGVERLSKDLESRGFSVDAIHGGKTQGHRQRALKRFRNNEVSILVATDVAARGIDVSDITHVINYSTPSSYEDYVHRIGRAGRAGRVGHALTFVSH